MARAQNDVCVIGSTRIAVGTSTIIRVNPLSNQVGAKIKSISGGSLEIVQPLLSGSSTAAAAGWGSGWLIGSGEVVSVEGPAAFYLAASGATAVAGVMFEYSYGATII